MNYLQEPAPKESRAIIILNHLTNFFFDDLEPRQIREIYATLTQHKKLNMQQGMLTVLAKLLGSAGYYHLILDIYLDAIKRGVKFDKQFYL